MLFYLQTLPPATIILMGGAFIFGSLCTVFLLLLIEMLHAIIDKPQAEIAADEQDEADDDDEFDGSQRA